MLIVKHGGVLTHAGRRQAEQLGSVFRNIMYPRQGGEGGAAARKEKRGGTSTGLLFRCALAPFPLAGWRTSPPPLPLKHTDALVPSSSLSLSGRAGVTRAACCDCTAPTGTTSRCTRVTRAGCRPRPPPSSRASWTSRRVGGGGQPAVQGGFGSSPLVLVLPSGPSCPGTAPFALRPPLPLCLCLCPLYPSAPSASAA